MYQRALGRCRQQVRLRAYVVTLHADDKMAAHGYGIPDVESGVLTGRILERQRDAKTHERKYRIRGVTRSVRPIELVVKLGPGGKLVIITVYDPRGKP